MQFLLLKSDPSSRFVRFDTLDSDPTIRFGQFG